MSWKQKRKHDIEENLLTLVGLLGKIEAEIIHESDPIAKDKLEKQRECTKKTIEDYKEEITQYTDNENNQKELALVMATITFDDIYLIITMLLNQQIVAHNKPELFSPTNPEVEMAKNGLTHDVRFLIDMGLAKANEVRHLIESNAKVNFPRVAENLKSSINSEYVKLLNQGIKGDDLFNQLCVFSSCNKSDRKSQAAGLAILCYFFETCDVFEP
jgi:hypothetical protein